MNEMMRTIGRTVFGVTLAAVAVAGCTGDEPKEEPVKKAQPTNRMHDPAYVQKLEDQRTEKNEILQRLAAAKAKLNAAKQAEAGEEEIAKINAEIKTIADAFEANRQKSMAIVRQQVMSGIKDAKSAQKGE